jgi:cell wall-associated NlpC family hydrolase
VRIATALLAIGVWSAVATAASADDRLVPHRVRPGETLTSIARSFGTSVDAIRGANPALDDTDVTEGTIVEVPPNPQWIRHIVARGDTLFALARLYQTSVDEIVAASALEGTGLEVGQVLVIPRTVDVAGAPPTSTGATVSETVPPPAATSAASQSGPPPAASRTVPPPASTSAVSGTVPPPAPASAASLRSAPSADARAVAMLPAPSVLEPRWMEVRLKDGRRAWALTASMIVSSPQPATPERIIEIARRFTGAPYRWGGETPNGADCSGFIEEVFRLGGYTLPRTADVQFQATQAVTTEQMAPGDLVFFTTYEPGPSHVGIYVGDGHFIHASSSRGVTESRLDERYYATRFLGARRIQAWPVPPPPLSAPGPLPTEQEPATPPSP